MKSWNEQKKKIKLTQTNVAKLEKELQILTKIERPKVISEIKTARKYGDLSENGEYDAAKKKQGMIEKKILEINTILNNYEIVQEKQTKIVRIASKVELLHLGENKKMTFQIGTFSDFDIKKNIIPDDSPLAKTIMGKKVGDKTFVKGVKNSYWIEILRIIN